MTSPSSMMSNLSKAASSTLSLGQAKAQALSGGKRRHKRRSMRGGSGGYNGMSSSGGVAANSASYSSSGYNQGGLGDLGGSNNYISGQSPQVRALYAATAGGRRRRTMRKRSRGRHSKRRRTNRGFMGLFKY
jgi:hypothetical protein